MNIFQEFLKCQESFTYFVSNYVKISNPRKGLVLFDLYGFQKNLISIYEKERYVGVLKFRQGGFTTITVIYALWKCMFFQDQAIMFISKTDKEAKHLAQIINIVLASFPEWLRPQMNQNTENFKSFSLTKSCAYFHCPKSASGRSITHLIIDEAAFIPQMDKHWKAMFPCLQVGGKCFAVSTVSVANGWFYDICTGTNDFVVYRPSYTEHPIYSDANWVAETKKQLGEVGWRQEVLCEFLTQEESSSLDGYSNSDLVKQLNDLSNKRKKVLTDDEQELLAEVKKRLSV